MNKALDKAATDNGITKEYLNDVPAGPTKRQMIDDVTIMVIDLGMQIWDKHTPNYKQKEQLHNLII